MNSLLKGLALSLALVASDARAEIMVDVDGTKIPMSTLMENCKSIKGDPAGQVACYNALSQLLNKQPANEEDSQAVVTKAFDALQKLVQYQDADSGLMIANKGCDVEVVYYNNYFHVSRRNVASLDLFNVTFDASKLQEGKTSFPNGGKVPLSKASMDAGVMASVQGGVNVESADHGFEAKSARISMADYAKEVLARLPVQNAESFDFVLVHPQKSQASGEIQNAFEAFVGACRTHAAPSKAGV